MTFKELKQNFPVFILDKDHLKLQQGKVVTVSFPRVQAYPSGKTEMVIDLQIDVDGKSASFVIPENSSITYANNMVLATDKLLLSNEVEAMKVCAEQALANVDRNKEILKRADEILVQLNPVFKEKKEQDERLSNIESAMSSIANVVEKQGKLLEQILNKGV